MSNNAFFDLLINRASFVLIIILFSVSLLTLIFRFKKLSTIKRTILICILIICLMILSLYVYLAIGFGEGPPDYVKRGLTLLVSNEVEISTVTLTDSVLTVKGKTVSGMKFAEGKSEFKDDKAYILIFAKEDDKNDNTFTYTQKGDLKNLKYVYLRSIEGGIGGLEDKLIFEKK